MKKRTNYKWTQEEISILRKLCELKTPFRVISRKYLTNRSYDSVASYAHLLGITNYVTSKKWDWNKDYWKEITLEKAAWAGMLMGDGCVHKVKGRNTYSFAWKVAAKDKHILEKFAKSIGYNGPIPVAKRKNSFLGYPNSYSEMADLTIYLGRAWVDDLKEKFGFVPRKTFHFPPPKLETEEQKWAYISGYCCADGCLGVRANTPQLTFVSCNKDILDWIHETINSKFKCSNNKTNKVCKSNQGNKYVLSYCGWMVCQIHNYMMKMDIPRLDRKWRNPALLEAIKKHNMKIINNENLDVMENNNPDISNYYLGLKNPIEIPPLKDYRAELCFCCGLIDSFGCLYVLRKTMPGLAFTNKNIKLITWLKRFIENNFKKRFNCDNKIIYKRGKNLFVLSYAGHIIADLYAEIEKLPIPKNHSKWNNAQLIECVDKYNQTMSMVLDKRKRKKGK